MRESPFPPGPSGPPDLPRGAEVARRLTVAREAAALGARVLADHRGHLTSVEWKGAVDLVTSADTASERLVIATLAAAFPDDEIIGEEGGHAGGRDASRPAADWVWYIDPLDGTTNFVHGLPHFSVSIGAAFRGDPVVGVIAAPVLGTTWYGSQGAGAFRVEHAPKGHEGGPDGAPLPIAVSTTTELQRALVATGFPYDRIHTASALVGPVARALAKCLCLRRLGSASLDLAYVAQGTFGAFWEPRLKPWDYAAGAAIIREAGGRVTDLAGGDDLWSSNILASNGHLHAAFLAEVIRGAD